MTSEATEYDIRVEELSKRFGDLEAVKGISFEVPRGEIFGFLGPNGAGKSTTIRMLTTLLRPTNGSAKVAGFDILTQSADVRRNVGLVAEKIILYDRLTALENLRFFGRMNHIPDATIKERSAKWLELLGMSEWSNKMVGTFSTGMKQRVNIARALLTSPRIMFLDEPTLGLDPQTTRAIRQFIKELAEQGITVVLTTHQMAEAEMLCDHIGVIDHGTIIALDTSDRLKQLIGDGQGAVLDLLIDGLTEEVRAKLTALPAVRAMAEPEASRLHITLADRADLGTVVEALSGNGAVVRSINMLEPNLEDVFLHLTGTEMRVEVGSSVPTAHRHGGHQTKRVR